LSGSAMACSPYGDYCKGEEGGTGQVQMHPPMLAGLKGGNLSD